MSRWVVVALVLLAAILIPFVLFEDRFNALAGGVLAGRSSPWSVGATVALLLAADVLLPIPSSVVSAGSGVALGFARGTLAVWIGMTLACVIGYAFGARASRAAAAFVGEPGMARARDLWQRFGDLAVVLCRPVPVLAEASVIFAGIIHRPFAPFILLSAVSNLGVALGYAAVGAYALGINSFVLAFAGSLVIPGLLMLASRRWLLAKRQAK